MFSSDFIDTNPRFIERIEDFKRFFPEFSELTSKKLKGTFQKSKKIGAIASLEGKEVLIKVLMSYERKVMFQIGVEKEKELFEVEKAVLELIDTFCFLFGNI